MARGIQVQLHGAAFGRGADLHIGARFRWAVRHGWDAMGELTSRQSSNVLGWIFAFCLLVVLLVIDRTAFGRRDVAGCLALPIGAVVFFLMWFVVGLFRFEVAPREGRVEVRDDALLCRFTDGILADLSWSEVIAARPGATESEVLIEHGQAHGRREITALRGIPAEITALRAQITRALGNYLPIEDANRVLGKDGKPIRDWLASVRSRFAPGAYRSGPPPLTRDQLVHLLLSPRIGAEVPIAAAAAVSVLDGERAGMSRVRIVTRQVESPALRIAAERALEDALDEAALAEATAEAPGARVNQG